MVSLNAADIRKLDPFFVGFDRLWKQIDTMHTAHPNTAGGYPPYNIRQVAEDHYHIEMAVAGFTQEDIEVLLQDGKLTVTGKVTNEEDGGKLLHRGIANRAFTREFTLSDTIEVEGADLENGILLISLKNIIPDHKKPKTIKVTSGGKLIEGKKELLTEE